MNRDMDTVDDVREIASLAWYAGRDDLIKEEFQKLEEEQRSR